MYPTYNFYLRPAMSIPPTYHRPIWLYILVAILLLPALLIHLGLPVLIDDEALRALVGLEMHYSGNYITPTVNGEFYYKKPPLYNWLLLGWLQLLGQQSEWAIRLPTVLCLLGYGATIYYFFQRQYTRQQALWAALMMLTCGRILFYDSMLGLIDVSYSWVVFTSFMVIYHQVERERWLRLFVLSYLLAAIGFLMKGLPSVVFQGATLLVWLAWQRKFWKLFTWQHLVGGGVFLLIVGGYYTIYHQYNSLENVFETLFTETTKRTVANHTVWRVVGHFFTFPFEVIYHFLPWTLLVLYFFRRGIRQQLTAAPFVMFSLLCFVANILVYWTAPKVYPRYLFMLVPLLFGVLAHLHTWHRRKNSWAYRTLYYLFGGSITVIALAAWSPLFLERTQAISSLWFKTIPLALLLAGLSYAYWQRWYPPILILVAALLTIRILFNFLVLPDRLANDYGADCRATTLSAAQASLGQPLFAYGDTEMQPTNTFYLMQVRKEIIPHHFDNFVPDALYIIDPELYPAVAHDTLTTFQVRHGKKTYHVGRLKD